MRSREALSLLLCCIAAAPLANCFLSPPLALRAPLASGRNGSVRRSSRSAVVSQLQPLHGAVAGQMLHPDAALLASASAAQAESAFLSGAGFSPLAFNPLEGVEDWLLHHPIQDVGILIVLISTIKFMEAGAALPVAIVASCLNLLNRIPGWTMIGSKPLLKLAISLLIDFVGLATFALPLVGEVGDLGWAPASAILVKALYNSNVLATIDLVEEVLPGTDILPTATIGWALEFLPGVRELGWVSGLAGTGRGNKTEKKA